MPRRINLPHSYFNSCADGPVGPPTVTGERAVDPHRFCHTGAGLRFASRGTVRGLRRPDAGSQAGGLATVRRLARSLLRISRHPASFRHLPTESRCWMNLLPALPWRTPSLAPRVPPEADHSRMRPLTSGVRKSDAALPRNQGSRGSLELGFLRLFQSVRPASFHSTRCRSGSVRFCVNSRSPFRTPISSVEPRGLVIGLRELPLADRCWDVGRRL